MNLVYQGTTRHNVPPTLIEWVQVPQVYTNCLGAYCSLYEALQRPSCFSVIVHEDHFYYLILQALLHSICGSPCMSSRDQKFLIYLAIFVGKHSVPGHVLFCLTDTCFYCQSCIQGSQSLPVELISNLQKQK